MLVSPDTEYGYLKKQHPDGAPGRDKKSFFMKEHGSFIRNKVIIANLLLSTGDSL
jgi:hypothetical protein